MPLTGGRKWRREPFNYTKACGEVAGWLFGVFLLMSLVLEAKRLIVVGGFLVSALFGVFARTIGWHLLPEDLRAQIPYDASESGKGTIHSHRDLWRYLRQRREM